MIATTTSQTGNQSKCCSVHVTNVKEFMNKEEASPSKMKTFNSLLQRVPGTATYEEFKFQISPEQLYAKKKLFVDAVVFVKDMPWSINFEPGSSAAHDVIIRCLYPSALWQEDFEIHASVCFSAPKPISSFSQTLNFRLSQKILVLPDCIPHNKLNSMKTNENSMLDFNVSIEIQSEKRKSHIGYLSNISFTTPSIDNGLFEEYVKQHMLCPHIQLGTQYEPSLLLLLLSVMSNLLSEETMRMSTGKEWNRLLLKVFNWTVRYLSVPKDINTVRKIFRASGIVEQIIFLLNGEFTQSTWAAYTPTIFINIIHYPGGLFDDDKLNTITQILLTQMKCKKSGPTLVSRIVLEIIPELYGGTDKGSKHRLVQLADNLEYLNDFYHVKNALFLAQKLGVDHPFDDAYNVYYIYQTFYHSMVLTMITAGRLQALPISTSKKFLVTLAENKINPYFSASSQALTFNNLTKLLWKHSTKELTGFWLSWLGDNAHRNPLLYDLVPSDVEFEVPFTSDCGCLDYSPLDVAKLMPIYHKIYTNYFQTVIKPLQNVDFYLSRDGGLLTSCSMTKIEKIKNKGNVYHKDRNFEKALEQYYKAIHFLMNRKLRFISRDFCEDGNESEFNVKDLLTICRSNMVSSNLELGRYHEAIVDATLTLREIHNLINDDWCMRELDLAMEKLKKREINTRFKRVKALINLEQWGPALQNILPVLYQDSFKDLATPYYYECLSSYMKEYETAQYPWFCVICAKEGIYKKSFEKLTRKCKDCKHPYCSSECQKKDKATHTKYCKELSLCNNKYG